MASADYHAPGIQCPTVEALRETSQKFGLQLTDKELAEYAAVIADYIPAYTLTANLDEPTLPVKYPRTPGHRPSQAENSHNAWYWKCDITGASEGPLIGKTIAIKDNVAVAGVPMMNGSRILEGYMPEFDASIVTRILDAGGRIVGKSTCEDLCVSGVCCTTAKGPVKNPIDTSRSAGGSSSGSAVLVALGEVDLAIGADQGGSIRIPASWCGIVGLKPTFGLVPYTGAIAIEPTVDHLGPMARTVSDVAQLLQVIAGPDGMDFRQKTDSQLFQIPKLSERIDGMKIGVLAEGFEKCEEEVQNIVKSALNLLKDAGAQAETVSILEHFMAGKLFTPVDIDGSFQNMVLGEGSGVGWKGFYPTSMCEHLRRGYKTMGSNMSEGCKVFVLLGDYVKKNYGNYFYNKAQNLCPRICKAYDDVLDEYDVLLMPTLPYTAPKAIPNDATLKEKMAHFFSMIVNTAPFDYTGHPALTVPAGNSEDGLPVGAMLVSKRFCDDKVLQVGYALEQQLKKLQK